MISLIPGPHVPSSEHSTDTESRTTATPARTLLRLTTAGSVDDGKSTLIGRLLLDSKGVLEDQWSVVERTSRQRGDDYTDLSLLTDGLRSEREQGITIDVAYRYFATPHRKFIVADSPGHTQYTRNMVTGASTARLAVVLVDARHGLGEQSRRHTTLSALLGIRHVVLAVNKMDLIDWDRDRFTRVRDEFDDFAHQLGVHEVTAIPLSALHGDNVTTPSTNTPWYDGQTLLRHLENVDVSADVNLTDVRLPVQYVIRPHSAEYHDHRSYAGTILGGILRPGEEVVVLPSGVTTRVASIDGTTGVLQEASPPMPVTVTLDDDIDVSRGDVIARPGDQPRLTQDLEATVCWMDASTVLREGGEFLLKSTTRGTRAEVVNIVDRLDVNTLRGEQKADSLAVNEIGRVRVRTRAPLIVDEYTRNADTGSFILIDTVNNNTVAAGTVLPPQFGGRASTAGPTSPDTRSEPSLVGRDERLSRGATLWFTGLSGAGKSTVARRVERMLLREGRPTYVLDGDNLRQGLNGDLGFSMGDRAENLRRTAHVAAMLADAGLVVLVPVISPLREHRDLARRIHQDTGLDFFEIHLDAPLEVCERRDLKGLYAKARAGVIRDFTGVNSPYEPPRNPQLRLTPDMDLQTAVTLVRRVLMEAR